MLEAIDIWLFYAVNHGHSNVVFDVVMPFVTKVRHWYPVYVIGLLYLLIWQGGRGRWCASAMMVAAAVGDRFGVLALKEPIGRIRPYDVLGDVNQLVGSGGGSFPSNHALNGAAVAMILSMYYPRLAWLWWSLALLSSYSRLYVGVHYPSDIAGGLLIGGALGYGLYRLAESIRFLVAQRRNRVI